MTEIEKSRRWQEAICPGSSIMDIALMMRMSANGSSEFDEHLIRECYWFLVHRIENWYSPTVFYSAFDGAVYALLCAAVQEVKQFYHCVTSEARMHPPAFDIGGRSD